MRLNESMVQQLPHFGHGQISLVSFKRILSLHLQNSLLVPVVVTTVCVLLMMGARHTFNLLAPEFDI
jgi:hypothetical protein